MTVYDYGYPYMNSISCFSAPHEINSHLRLRIAPDTVTEHVGRTKDPRRRIPVKAHNVRNETENATFPQKRMGLPT